MDTRTVEQCREDYIATQREELRLLLAQRDVLERKISSARGEIARHKKLLREARR